MKNSKNNHSENGKSKDTINSSGSWKHNTEKDIRRAGRIQPARVQYIPPVRQSDSRMTPPPQAKSTLAPKDTVFDRAKMLYSSYKNKKNK